MVEAGPCSADPAATIRPSWIGTMRSAVAAATGSWVMSTTVCPSRSTASRRSARTASEESESRLPVGSSAKSTSGRVTRARAIATRCCWPPESSCGRCFRRSASPRRSRSAPIRDSVATSGRRPARRNGSRTFSDTVSPGSRLKAWKTNPTWSRRNRVRVSSSSPVTERPPMATVPVVGSSRPASTWSSVDLPDPDRPVMAVIRPASMSRSIPRRAWTGAVSPPNVFVMPRTDAAGVFCMVMSSVDVGSTVGIGRGRGHRLRGPYRGASRHPPG